MKDKTGFTAISKFEVRNNMEDEVRQAFKNRPHLVDDAPGFLGLQVLSPKENDSEFWLVTHWETEKHFHEWHDNHRSEAHQGIPKGLKLVKKSWSLTYFDLIAN